MMEPMICETFLQFRYLSDLGLSPDGRYTALYPPAGEFGLQWL